MGAAPTEEGTTTEGAVSLITAAGPQIRTTQSLSALGSLQKTEPVKPPPPIPELGPDSIVSTSALDANLMKEKKLGRGGFGTWPRPRIN